MPKNSDITDFIKEGLQNYPLAYFDWLYCMYLLLDLPFSETGKKTLKEKSSRYFAKRLLILCQRERLTKSDHYVAPIAKIFEAQLYQTKVHEKLTRSLLNYSITTYTHPSIAKTTEYANAEHIASHVFIKPEKITARLKTFISELKLDLPPQDKACLEQTANEQSGALSLTDNKILDTLIIVYAGILAAMHMELFNQAVKLMHADEINDKIEKLSALMSIGVAIVLFTALAHFANKHQNKRYLKINNNIIDSFKEAVKEADFNTQSAARLFTPNNALRQSLGMPETAPKNHQTKTAP